MLAALVACAPQPPTELNAAVEKYSHAIQSTAGTKSVATHIIADDPRDSTPKWISYVNVVAERSSEPTQVGSAIAALPAPRGTELRLAIEFPPTANGPEIVLNATDEAALKAASGLRAFGGVSGADIGQNGAASLKVDKSVDLSDLVSQLRDAQLLEGGATLNAGKVSIEVNSSAPDSAAIVALAELGSQKTIEELRLRAPTPSQPAALTIVSTTPAETARQLDTIRVTSSAKIRYSVFDAEHSHPLQGCVGALC